MSAETTNSPTIIQLPNGEAFGSTSIETPEEAAQRLRRDGWLVQRIGNVVRIVRPLKLGPKPRREA